MIKRVMPYTGEAWEQNVTYDGDAGFLKVEFYLGHIAGVQVILECHNGTSEAYVYFDPNMRGEPFSYAATRIEDDEIESVFIKWAAECPLFSGRAA